MSAAPDPVTAQVGALRPTLLPPDGGKRGEPHRPKKEPKTRTLPPQLNGPGPDSNDSYSLALSDPPQNISPQALGFVPSNYWLNAAVSFGDLVSKFFHRKNNASCRFPHKLYNALRLVDNKPALFPLVGVRWVADSLFLVDKYVFGRLIGIASFDGGLFHRQGNFPSHGFLEIAPEESPAIDGIDFDRFRLLMHPSGQFRKLCPDEFFNSCKWVNV
jgi:hypothetical protein